MQIYVFCQQYLESNTNNVKEGIKKVEREIMQLQTHLGDENKSTGSTDGQKESSG